MTLIVLGLALWWAAHLFKRMFPGLRAGFGDPFKGLVSLVLVAGIVAMVFGYRGADFIPVWTPPSWGQHANNLLMLISVALFGLGNSKSRLAGRMRHPMLTGMLVWTIAHLLVRGDLAAVLLFGGLGIWAIIEMVVINSAEPEWQRKTGGSAAGDIKLVVISVVVFAVIGFVHGLLGPSPFPM